MIVYKDTEKKSRNKKGTIHMKATSHCTTPLAQRFSAAGLLRFAAPSIGMSLIIAIYTVTDGIFIGRFAGADALAATNIVYPVINLLLGLGIMLASGGSALVGKTLGENDPASARRRFTLISAAGALIGLLFSLLCLAFFTPILHLLGASPALMADCRDYLAAFLPFFPAAMLLLIFNAFYIVDGRPSMGFIVSVLSGLTNAGLDYLFLACLHLGILGAGIATGLSYALAAVFGLIYFARASRLLRFTAFAPELRTLGRAAYNGMAEMVTQCSVGITTFLFNLITFAWAGEDGVAAISVILYAEMLLTALLLGFSNGIAPIFSYHFGAGHGFELLRLLRLALILIGCSGLIAYGIAQLLAAPITALFLPQGGHVYDLTREGFALFSLSFLLCGYNLFTAGFFTALSNGRTSALCSLVRNLLGISIFLAVLPHFFELRGVWLAVPASDLTALIFCLYCLRSEAGEILDTCRQRYPRLLAQFREDSL